MKLNNKVQLITYPDSLGKNLKELIFVLDNYIKDAIGGVHILPFYPSSADRGFSPLTHLEVDFIFGTWQDIKEISSKYDLVVDLLMNHISSKSLYFQDYLKNGDNSKYKDLFLSIQSIFPQGVVNTDELNKIYRPRPQTPFTTYQFKDNSKKDIWTTFTSDQIDLNWESKITKQLVGQFLTKLVSSGAKIIRLDAVGYISKELGTNCFFLPKVYEIINELKEITKKNQVYMLPEVHFHYTLQQEISKKEDLVYDFALPMLMLHTLYTSNSKALKQWIKIRPNNCVITLDTHDGIGNIDVEELLTKEELELTHSMLYQYGGKETTRASGIASSNLDIYQINCSYYSALNQDDKQYLCARVIQFFLPGIPQVYYVGLLAGVNDIELLNKTNNGRDINRHYYTIEEIEQNLKRTVVKELFELMRFRNTHPAFNGEFKLHNTSDNIIKLSWTKDEEECILEVDLNTFTYSLKQEQVVLSK